MLADPNINKKVVSGEITLSDGDKERGKAVVRDVYVSQLEPALNNIITKSFKGKDGAAIGDVLDFQMENGVLTVKFTAEEIDNQNKRAAVVQSVSGKSLSEEQQLAISNANIAREALDNVQQLVAKTNKVAMAMATLSGKSKAEPFVRNTFTSLLKARKAQ
jgi:hypothetical protein